VTAPCVLHNCTQHTLPTLYAVFTVHMAYKFNKLSGHGLRYQWRWHSPQRQLAWCRCDGPVAMFCAYVKA